MIFMIIVLPNVFVCTGVPIVFCLGVKLSDCMTVSCSCYCCSVVKQGSNKEFICCATIAPFVCARPFCVMCLYSCIERLLNFYLRVERFVLEGRKQPGYHGPVQNHKGVQQSELNSGRNGQSSRLKVLLTIMTTGCTDCKDSPLC